MPARIHAVTATAVLALTTSGCAGLAPWSAEGRHPTGGGLPTTAPLAPSSSSDLPVTPPEALLHSDEGARAFTRHFFVVETRAYAQMNGLLLEPLSAAECSACYGTYYTIDEQRALGNRVVGYRRDFAPSSVSHHVRDPDAVTVFGVLSGTGGQRVDADEKVLNSIDSVVGKAALTLEWKNGHWLVTDASLTR